MTAGDCHHGMHIYSDAQGIYTSTSSLRSLSKYDIWRSWEDCLLFQNKLEVEYARAAREKRKRLAQGKGVKGYNGLYKKDMAASWDSLPSGPDHRSVAQNIHQHLPTLTKRGTLFRPSQATIDQRQAELIAFIEALFNDSMPSLIEEIRVSNIVSEFFGLWRSDVDIVQESRKRTVPRKSLTDPHFSASHRSLPSIDTAYWSSRLHSKVYSRSLRSIEACPASLTEISEEPRYPSESPPRSRSRPISTSSDSSALSDCSLDTSLSSSSGPAIADNVPIVFAHSPTSDQFNPILDVLPEEQETLPKSPEPEPKVKPRPRTSTTECKVRRSYSFFGLSLQKSLFSSARSGIILFVYSFLSFLIGCRFLGDRSVRESWQSADSQGSTVNDLLDGLPLVLPHPIKEQKFRASIASVSTFMTTNSADAVIPQTPQGSSEQCTSTSLLLLDADGKHSVPGKAISILYAYFSRLNFAFNLVPFPLSVSSISESTSTEETQEVDDLPLPASPTSTTRAFDCPPSPSCTSISSSAFSTTTTPSLVSSDSISIKAIHDTCIILLRVSRQIGLAEVKQRLYDKFTNQEKISLSDTYDVVFVPPTTGISRTDVQVITLDSDWEQLKSSLQGNKMTLRIRA